MSENQFKGVIINASFPRSGHRFLRELCMGYFGQNMVFFDSYSQNTIIGGRLEKAHTQLGNYVKTHDFGLQGFDVLKERFPLRRKYLVQVRHPIESIASYYEFALKNNEVKQDSKKNWLRFLEEKLEYWKRFCKTWLAEEKDSVLLVTYESLYHSTEAELTRVIQFITGDDKIDKQRFSSLVNKKSFNQYVGENSSSKSKKREIQDFKYFDKKLFTTLQDELYPNYLSPLGIKVLSF